MLGETVLGPIWVWLAIGEAPTELAFVGGGIVLGALFLNTLVGIRRHRRLRLAESRAL